MFAEDTRRLGEDTSEARTDIGRTLVLALDDLGPGWALVGDCEPVDVFDPSHWPAGTRSFQVTLRHRVTGRLKVLGRRIGDAPTVDSHRGVPFSLVETYRQGNADPLRRYLEDIGVAGPLAPDAGQFFRRRGADASSRTPGAGAPAAASDDVAAVSTATVATHVEAHERASHVLLSAVSRAVRREFGFWQWRRAYARQAATNPTGRDMTGR